MSGAAKLTKVSIRGYRSIGPDGIEIDIPTTRPLVLIGENNAGKSNILNALSLVLSESWAASHDPEDHEYFGRSPSGSTIDIRMHFRDLSCPKCPDSQVSTIFWTMNGDSGDRPNYGMVSSCHHNWVTNELKNELSCVLIGTERGLDYQLSYKSKWTTMSKLMRGFHSHLVKDPERVRTLTTYYEGLVEIFQEIDSFKMFSQSLTEYTRDFSGNMPYGLGVNFSAYDPSNFFQSLRMLPSLDGESRSFDELGTGQAQVLAIAFAYAYSRAFGSQGLVLLVEEPESHLHPLAQEWFAGRLQNLVEAGSQVVISTHSPYFVDLSLPGSYALVRKAGEGHSTTISQLMPSELVDSLVSMGAPTSIVSSRTVGDFYESAATNDIKAGLFARGCLLVEGLTEKLGLTVLLERAGLETVRKGIAIVPVEGINNLPKWIRFFRSYDIPVFAIFDSDRHKSGGEAKKLQSTRLEIFEALGLEGGLDWNERPRSESDGLGGYYVMDSDYERWIRNLFGREYQILEERAAELFGTSKPLRARWCANQLGEDTQSGWDSVSELANAILLKLGL